MCCTGQVGIPTSTTSGLLGGAGGADARAARLRRRPSAAAPAARLPAPGAAHSPCALPLHPSTHRFFISSMSLRSCADSEADSEATAAAACASSAGGTASASPAPSPPSKPQHRCARLWRTACRLVGAATGRSARAATLPALQGVRGAAAERSDSMTARSKCGKVELGAAAESRAPSAPAQRGAATFRKCTGTSWPAGASCSACVCISTTTSLLHTGRL